MKLNDAQRHMAMMQASPSYRKDPEVFYLKMRALESPPEAVERDAARYRWLKEHHLQTGLDSWIRTGDDLEDAIDAAMRSDAPTSESQK